MTAPDIRALCIERMRLRASATQGPVRAVYLEGFAVEQPDGSVVTVKPREYVDCDFLGDEGYIGHCYQHDAVLCAEVVRLHEENERLAKDVATWHQEARRWQKRQDESVPTALYTEAASRAAMLQEEIGRLVREPMDLKALLAEERSCRAVLVRDLAEAREQADRVPGLTESIARAQIQRADALCWQSEALHARDAALDDLQATAVELEQAKAERDEWAWASQLREVVAARDARIDEQARERDAALSRATTAERERDEARAEVERLTDALGEAQYMQESAYEALVTTRRHIQANDVVEDQLDSVEVLIVPNPEHSAILAAWKLKNGGSPDAR